MIGSLCREEEGKAGERNEIGKEVYGRQCINIKVKGIIEKRKEGREI